MAGCTAEALVAEVGLDGGGVGVPSRADGVAADGFVPGIWPIGPLALPPLLAPRALVGAAIN